MPTILVPQTTEVTIHYQNATNLYENVLHYRWSSATVPTATQLDSLCAQVRDGVGLKLRACVSDGWTFVDVVAKNLNADPGNQGSAAWPSGTHGTLAGSQVAANEACSIVKRTGLSGHGQHGRMSVSGFTEGSVDGNSLSSSIIGLLTTLALELLTRYVTGIFIPALAHKRPAVPLATSSTPLTFAGVLDSNIDSQKTRLNSHGR